MLIENPNYPNIIMSFDYRGFTLDLEQDEDNGISLFSVWANHAFGCAVAVPGVVSRAEAIYRGKQWVDRRIQARPRQRNGLRIVGPSQ